MIKEKIEKAVNEEKLLPSARAEGSNFSSFTAFSIFSLIIGWLIFVSIFYRDTQFIESYLFVLNRD